MVFNGLDTDFGYESILRPCQIKRLNTRETGNDQFFIFICRRDFMPPWPYDTVRCHIKLAGYLIHSWICCSSFYKSFISVLLECTYLICSLVSRTRCSIWRSQPNDESNYPCVLTKRPLNVSWADFSSSSDCCIASSLKISRAYFDLLLFAFKIHIRYFRQGSIRSLLGMLTFKSRNLKAKPISSIKCGYS